jgi:hypothetical protein
MAEQRTVEMISYTESELAEFDRLTVLTSSRDQVRRIDGRMKLSHFVTKHGNLKCDEMFAEIKRREAATNRGRR